MLKKWGLLSQSNAISCLKLIITLVLKNNAKFFLPKFGVSGNEKYSVCLSNGQDDPLVKKLL
jgi:hypothetical protein